MSRDFAHRYIEASELVAAHDRAEQMHAAACRMARGPERERSLADACREMSRASTLLYNYTTRYIAGGCVMSERDFGESRADYSALADEFYRDQMRLGIEDARQVVKAKGNQS